MGNFRFLILLSAAFFFGFLQRPDLVLTSLITAAFFLNFWSLAIVSLLGILLLKNDSVFARDWPVLLAGAAAVFGLNRLLPWRPLLNYCLLLLAGVFIGPLLTGQPLLIMNIIFNLGLGLAFYLFLSRSR